MRMLLTYKCRLMVQLDPSSLATRGEFTFDGVLQSGQPVASQDALLKKALDGMSGKDGYLWGTMK